MTVSNSSAKLQAWPASLAVIAGIGRRCPANVFANLLWRRDSAAGMIEAASAMDAFRFSPELFEYRTEIMSVLGQRGFDWLSHYTAVDPLHDVYGLEVCGISDEDDALAILKILIEMYPDWKAIQPWYSDGSRDTGWRAQIQRDEEPPERDWQTAE